jgi:Ca-activated chloride channel family protein
LVFGLDDELLTVKLRYKKPDGDVSKLLSVPVSAEAVALDSSSVNMQFSAALSLFGMTLLDQDLKISQRMGQLQEVIKLAKEGKGEDEDGRRAEFIRMAELAMAMR